ncbi:MAG: hypothetical protein ACH350_00390 [Parachlamydiaceae bacterium]
MIRLTVNAQSNPEIHLFNQSTILIGADDQHADLVLTGSHIEPIHLKIITEKNVSFLINYTNDPFVSLNGLSFGKKRLNCGDLITIDQNTLLFETIDSPLSEQKEDNAPTSVASLKTECEIPGTSLLCTHSLIQDSPCPSFSLPFENEVGPLHPQDVQKTSLEHYLNDLKPKDEPSKDSSMLKEKKEEDRRKMISLKDDYLKDLDDDHQFQESDPFNKEQSHLYQAWKLILLFIFSLLTISGGVGSIIYLTLSDKTDAQETKAAQGVADVAMALMYAQINHLKPHNHNWSDVDFLKNNLQMVLPDPPSYASQIDAQGQFNCCPYSLRIYTSSDLSHFLLIAQPAPNLFNWLIPQSLIVVDSHLMELRILKDVRGLNRLLANPNPLDGANGKEITSLIKQEEVIHLAKLAHDSGHQDFAPPKNLAAIRPGAENFIYNAPRYYRLGHNIIQKSITLATSKGSSQEVTALKEEIESLSYLNDFVLYSDQGKKSASLVRQGLTLFAPSDKLLYGYLLFNAQGKIFQVYLLKEAEEREQSSSVSELKDQELVALNTSSETNFSTPLTKKEKKNGAIDSNHPIYIQLNSLIIAREHELKPLIIALENLANQELQFPKAQFQFEFQNLSHTYLMTNAKHKQALREALDKLYHQYEEMPITQFILFVKALNLEELIQQEGNALTTIDENCQQNMELLLTYIDNSKSLTELDNLVDIAGSWLNFDYIKDPDELIRYQNLFRNHLLEQLEKYLLSQKKHFLVKVDDREILHHILTQERLIKPEEKEFFLQEFDEMVLHHPIEEKK